MTSLKNTIMYNTTKILIADSHEDTRELTSLILNNNLMTSTKLANDSQMAIDILNKDPDYDLIISDLHMNSGSGLDLYWFAKKNNHEIPFIFLTGADKILSPDHIKGFQKGLNNNFKNIFLSKPFDQDSLMNYVKIASKNPLPLGVKLEDDQVLQVDTKKLIEYKISNVKIMLKIGENKYIGITTQTEDDFTSIYEKYLNKGINSLYLDVKYLSNLESQAKGSLPQILDRISSQPVELIHYQIEALDLLYSNLSTDGFDQQEIKIINSIVNTSMELIKSHQPIWKLLDESTQKHQFISKHSLILGHICCHFLIVLGWSDQDALKNIFTAALIHDLAFSSDTLAQIHDLRPQLMVKLPRRKVESIKNHTIEISQMAKKSGLSEQIIDIVSSHHENALGSGYPHKKIGTHLHQYQATFIIAQEILHSLIINNFNFQTTKNISKAIESFYSHGAFKHPMQNINKLCEKLEKFA